MNDPLGSEGWFQEGKARHFELPELSLKELDVVPAPVDSQTFGELQDIGMAGDNRWAVIFNSTPPTFATIDRETSDQWQFATIQGPKRSEELDRYEARSEMFGALLPFIYSIAFNLCSIANNIAIGKPLPSIDSFAYWLRTHLPLVLLTLVVILVSVVATYFACRRRSLTSSQIVGWCGWAILSGLATPLAVIAIYTRPTFVRCSRCEKSRRIDRQKCESCGADWEPPVNEGIEIFDANVNAGSRLVETTAIGE